MAMPAKPSDLVGCVDVRDLAEHVLRSVESIQPGHYNMVNKPLAANFGDLIDLSLKLGKSESEVVWLDRDFLLKQKEIMGEDFRQFPMWHDPEDPKEAAVETASQSRAVKNGFSNRPFKQTVVDTFNWWINESKERRENRRVMISSELENSLLAAWDDRSAS
jgi:hypothetical protein